MIHVSRMTICSTQLVYLFKILSSCKKEQNPVEPACSCTEQIILLPWPCCSTTGPYWAHPKIIQSPMEQWYPGFPWCDYPDTDCHDGFSSIQEEKHRGIVPLLSYRYCASAPGRFPVRKVCLDLEQGSPSIHRNGHNGSHRRPPVLLVA